MRLSFLFSIACASALQASVATAQLSIRPATKKPAAKPSKPKAKQKTIILTDRRSYRFDVQKVDPRLYVTAEKQWTFAGKFPRGLSAALRKQAGLKKLEQRLLRDAGKNAEGGFVRWPPDKKRTLGAGALLWFVAGPKQRMLGVSVDAVVDAGIKHKVKPASLSFGPLQLTVDLERGRVSGVRYGRGKMPDKSSAADHVAVEDTAEVDATGLLTAKSSRALRAADEVFSGEILQKLRLLGWADLRNESHYGITLGWLGQEHLTHHLFLLAGKPQDPFAFRYRVGGKSFPLKLVRRQLDDAGWPMVLAGHQYVGSGKGGVRVFQPVEFVLSKPSAKAGESQ